MIFRYIPPVVWHHRQSVNDSMIKTLCECHIDLYKPVSSVVKLLLSVSRTQGIGYDDVPCDLWLCLVRLVMALCMNSHIDQACNTQWRLKKFEGHQYMVLRNESLHRMTYSASEFPWEPYHEYIAVLYRDQVLHINNLYYAPHRYPIALAHTGVQKTLLDWRGLGPLNQVLFVIGLTVTILLWYWLPGPLFPRINET